MKFRSFVGRCGRAGGSGRHRAAAILAFSLGASGCGSGWTSPDYQPGALDAPPETGEVRGLTVLISFADEAISDVQARKLFRAMNEPGYADDGNFGSVRDYFADMSGGALTLQNRVVRVQLPEPKSTYDTNEKDDFHAPSNLQSIEDITINGPSTRLLSAVLCRLRTCGGAAPEYQEVTAAGVSSTIRTDLSFSGLSTRRLGFWPDSYVRDFVNNGYLNDRDDRDLIDIPNITLYSYVNLLYAGRTTQTEYGHGLWPRSVPSIGTLVPGDSSGVRLGRFQLQGTLSAPGSTDTNVGTLVHETAHTLFDLPDLYDSGHELRLDVGASLVQSQGIATHALMGLTGSEKQLPVMSAPLKDRLGWANVVDISDAAEGTTIELSANGAEVARYCRPGSALDECFYIEVRSASHARGPSGFRPFTPDEGLVIWHSENSRNVLDFVVNNHEEGTANLHYEVALMQADGKRELEGPRGTGNLDDDYFHAGHADRFDQFTAPSSKWWDGTPSGLSIRNISAVGGSMTFEIGKRPLSFVHVDADPRVSVDAGEERLVVGERRTVSVTAEPGFRFDIKIQGREHQQEMGLTGTQAFEIVGSILDNYIKVIAYPDNQASPTYSVPRFVKYTMTEGATVTAYAERGRSFLPRSRPFDFLDAFTTFRPGQGASRYAVWDDQTFDQEYRTYAGNGSVHLFAKAEPGYVLKSFDVYGSNHASVRVQNAAFRKTASAEVTVPVGEEAGDFYHHGFLALVNAEPIPGYFCRDDSLEVWDPTKVYRDVGDKVRYGQFVYSSNVPRNFLRGNVDSADRPISPPPRNPDNSPTHWTRIASCSGYTLSCSSVPEWSLGGNAFSENPHTSGWQNNTFTTGARARFNGQLWEYVGSGYSYNEVPGASASRQILDGAEAFATVEKDIPIYSNRALVYRRAAAWKLLGNCDDPDYWRRATIVPSEGVKAVRPQGVTSVNHHPSEPTFVSGLTADWSFEFELEDGYELVDVVIDGNPFFLSPGTRSVSIPFAERWRPAYVEVITTCNQASCGASASAPAAQVRCELGPPQQWGIGFVYPTISVTNISGQPITGWNVRLDFDAPPDLWDSSGVNFEQNGSSVVVSNAYAWSGQLAPGGTFNFSVGGNLSGPFVPPTCTGL